ncbi:hypothetical protein [Flavobacterium sp. Root420]|uniref:hypothetical protein n=1 Tax=Flavobacterium sp. Root420 TaxID=1736533 RepID=UPI0006F9B176|nr:hypothetical protein [Flavobacterium sp. Root420]KQX02565.1 hypothetical protein ASC72_23215 [Flavobacterium sp. Root420]
MKKKITLFLLFAMAIVKAQTGINTITPQARLDIVSTTSGILIPRMTAIQAENIPAPALGELAYSTTANGTTINDIGFWYYDGAIWRPLKASLPAPQNIYTVDGTLEADRSVNLNGHNLNFDPNKLALKAATQRIGMGENAPTTTAEVKGNVRVRNLTAGNVVALSNGTLAIGPKFAYGTVKESLRTADHNGWYKLDGRALNTLPAAAQANAAAIGLSGTLANADSRMMKQGTPFATGGANTYTLTKVNMPNFTMSGTTSTAAAHTHTFGSGGWGMDWAPGGNNLVVRTGGPVESTNNVAVDAAADHGHALSFNTGGSNTPFNILPEYITFTYFIYLSQ